MLMRGRLGDKVEPVFSIPYPPASLIAFSKMPLKSPPASHIANPLNFVSCMNLPFAANDCKEEKNKLLYF